MPRPGLQDNLLLSALPISAFSDLKQKATFVSLTQGVVLCEPGGEVDQIFFPLSGMISLVFVMQTGRAIETATIGAEGVYGAMAGLGVRTSHVRAVVQIPLEAVRIGAPAFRMLVAAHIAVRDMCLAYNEVLLEQARITAACNVFHQVESRFCRWLLQTSDRTRSNEVPLTHEFLSEMLGVRRPSVTDVANKIQKAGIIRYSRGRITILDREKLETMSCECYDTLRARAPA